MGKKNPCHGCGKRHAEKGYNCHSECHDYRIFRQELDEENAAIRKKRADEAMMDEVRFETIKKVKGGKAIQTARKR